MNPKKQMKKTSVSENFIDWKIKRGLSSPIARPQTDEEMLKEFKARLKKLK